MDLPRYNNSFLLRQFHDFYGVVARLRRTVEISGYDPMAGAAAQDTAAVAVSGEGLWQQLLTILERQALEASQTGGAFAFEIYREAQYVMAALADEVFLHVSWEGKNTWPLLEARLFQTHIAGEAVFQRLDRLLQRRDPFYMDLASIYFMALSLGFQGKFRDSHNLEPLIQYRRQLFAMIYRRTPKLFSSADPLFPQSYEHTLNLGAGKKLADQRVWWSLVGIVLILWLTVSQATWINLSSQVECLICKVTGGTCVCDAGSVQ